ncbi:hypothetical protein GQ43DRAFT_110481 [Delitschia confertaspora ATCC 74209]|uniref:Glutaredoxin-like protein n=1 Tax=Delitschia confertaspora ATCC 74209 TaxID=1513339 RepID=A0A9P4JTJ9_9PLEO|nr:hypothetical protein GQ43DRAFT_110481 [Delitschia confertaspora ATCC 74209]
MFRTTPRLLNCRITFFTRANCSLCDNAKAVVQSVKDKHNRQFEYTEINVMEPGQEKWKSAYEFDTPVIHVDNVNVRQTTTEALKLMHRFKAEEVMGLMDQAEKS